MKMTHRNWIHAIGWFIGIFLGLIFFTATVAGAQTITTSPVNSSTETLQVSVGAQALGLGTAAAGTDAVAKVSIVTNLAARNDVILVPTANFKANFSGFQYNLPTSIFSKTNLSGLQLYTAAGVGPEENGSVTHVGFTLGGGANWLLANNVIVNIAEVRWMHAPGYGNGSGNVPVVSGGISLFF